MSRRARAVVFFLLALAAAALAAGIADGYGARVASGYGSLRPVVVVGADLPAGEAIEPRQLSLALEVRRVPRQFVPPGSLRVPGEALGLVPRAPIPAGAYLLGPQLRPPNQAGDRPNGLEPGLHPVEISVSGADALLDAGPLSPGVRVDVVVTSEPDGSGPGRAYVAATGVPLLSLGPAADGAGVGGLSAATIGLTRHQALHLIGAESFARRITLLPEG